MAGTVIYFDSLKDLALKSELSRHDQAGLNILVKVNKGPTTPEEYALVRRRVENELDTQIASLSRDILRGGRTATFFLTQPGLEAEAGDDSSRSYFAFLTGIEQQITIV